VTVCPNCGCTVNVPQENPRMTADKVTVTVRRDDGTVDKYLVRRASA